MLSKMIDKANSVVNGNYIVDIVDRNSSYFVSVRHYDIDNDPCAGQNEVLHQLYRVLGACYLNKIGNILHSGGSASVLCKIEESQYYHIGNYEVRMVKSLADKWNTGGIHSSDESEIDVFIPIPVNHYKIVRYCDLFDDIKDFMSDFEAIPNQKDTKSGVIS